MHGHASPCRALQRQNQRGSELHQWCNTTYSDKYKSSADTHGIASSSAIIGLFPESRFQPITSVATSVAYELPSGLDVPLSNTYLFITTNRAPKRIQCPHLYPSNDNFFSVKPGIAFSSLTVVSLPEVLFPARDIKQLEMPLPCNIVQQPSCATGKALERFKPSPPSTSRCYE
jgi:hypothetical protein